MAGLKMNPRTVTGSADSGVTGFYCAARCESCSDVHFAIGTKAVVHAADGAVLATVMLSPVEARQLAAELLALAEVH